MKLHQTAYLCDFSPVHLLFLIVFLQWAHFILQWEIIQQNTYFEKSWAPCLLYKIHLTLGISRIMFNSDTLECLTFSFSPSGSSSSSQCEMSQEEAKGSCGCWEGRQICVPVPALPLSSCLSLDKSLTLWEFMSSHQQQVCATSVVLSGGGTFGVLMMWGELTWHTGLSLVVPDLR